MNEFRPFIEACLREASGVAMKYFGNVEATFKDGDPQVLLTEADLAVGTYLIDAVRQQFPDHNIIDEETGVIDNHSEYTWVIDPIDGTSNFAAGLPQFGVMIGLLHGADVVAGGFALPAYDSVYSAAEGEGAWKNGKHIQVTSEPDLRRMLVAYGLHAKTDETARQQGEYVGRLIRGVRNLRASASTYDIAMVAEGKYGAFISSRGQIWDCVGPQAVITEAGGVFTHFEGSPIDYSDALQKSHQQFDYFMASPVAHEQMLKLLLG